MKRLFLILAIMPLSTLTKVLIITHSFNRPDFIEIHAKTFKALLKDEYEYVVFNDASNENIQQQIEQTCINLGIRCFRVPQNLHNIPGETSAGHRHMHGIKYSLESAGFEHDGIVALIDSDMFLIKPFSIEKYLAGYDIAGDLEGRKNDIIEIRHLSPMLVFMNMPSLPNKKTLNFDGGYIEGLGCDVGGHTYFYLKNNPSIKPLFFSHIHVGAWKAIINCPTCTNMSCNACIKLLKDRFDNVVIKFIQECPDDIEFFLNDTFLHYRSGSNWNHKPAEYHTAKTMALKNLFDAKLKLH